MTTTKKAIAQNISSATKPSQIKILGAYQVELPPERPGSWPQRQEHFLVTDGSSVYYMTKIGFGPPRVEATVHLQETAGVAQVKARWLFNVANVNVPKI
jgi:hypothetical protein